VSLWTVMRIEWRRMWRNRLVRAGMAAACVLPLLYSALYLWAFWDPYGKLDRLPVAVVNQDLGGTLDGKHVNYGKDLVDSLVDQKDLDWHAVTQAQAQAGLSQGRYYMELRVPSSFTKDVLSVTSNRPRRAQLVFIPDQGRNYLAGQILARAQKDIAATLSQKFSKQFISRLLDVVGQEAGGLSKVAATASELAKAGQPLNQGSQRLASGVHDADDGAHRLAAALTKLYSGSGQLTDGLGKVTSGTNQVATGVAQAESGISRIRTQISPAAGPSSRLAQGMQQAASAAGQLEGASRRLQSGSANAQSTATQLSTGLADAQDGAKQVESGLTSAIAALNQAPATDPHVVAALSALNQSLQGSRQLASGLGQLQSGADKLANGLSQEASGQQQLTSGLAQLSSQLGSAATATRQFSTQVGQLDSDLAQLQGGLSKAHTSLAQLATAEGQLYQGAEQLQSGLGSAHSGAASLASGLDNAASGSRSLADGVAKLTSGQQAFADKLAESQPGRIGNPSAKADVMSHAIDTKTEALHPVNKYGPGLAPYFLPLSLWVGAILLYFLMPLREARWRMSPVSSLTVTLGKLGVLWAIGVVQALIAATVVLYGLGLAVTTVPGFYLFAIGLAITDITVIGMLISVLGTGPGRVLAIVLLLLQLTSAGGTFPIQLVPPFFQALHPWLPMSYAVNGLRNLIAFPNHLVAWENIGVDGIFFAVSFFIMVLVHWRRIRPSQLQAPDTLVS
jgi:putative membrane protein